MKEAQTWEIMLQKLEEERKEKLEEEIRPL